MMMSYEKSLEILNKSCLSLKATGAEKTACDLSYSKTHELNVDGGEISLFRTIFNTELTLAVIKDAKKGTMTTNRTDEDSISETVQETYDIALSSEKDPAYDISEQNIMKKELSGDEPDADLMYERLKEFTVHVREKYPAVIMEQAILDYKVLTRHHKNSNGADLYHERGFYEFTVMFSAKKGEKSSSFNYANVAMNDLSSPLLDMGGVNRLMGEAPRLIETKPFPGKCVGQIIVTPECLLDFIMFLSSHLSDRAMITRTSFLKDSLGKDVASPLVTLRSLPLDPCMAGGYAITRDGFPADNLTLIEKGVLKSYLLSQYGAAKCKMDRAASNGYFYVLDPGHDSLDAMVRRVEKGLLLTRFSGGNPGENGDFSGVAKNSFLIENGQIKHGLSETMISGNIKGLFQNITAVSEDVNDSGHSRIPWVLTDGITISGK